MAGEKLSPRQKMIGMMYLVLTALLALQVTSSVLDRFYFLDLSLSRQVEETAKKNTTIVNNISSIVAEKGNRESDVAVLNKAKKVREETKKIQNYVQALKDTLVVLTGEPDETGKPTGAKDEDNTANLMINKKKGDELQKILNGYAEFLRKETGEGKEDFPDIAYDGKDHPVFKNDSEQKVKDFAHLNFQATPMIAAMATITQFETEVMAYETKALNDLAAKVGAEDVSFDQIDVRVIPQSNVVAAGAFYEADMFIAASSSAVDPEMFFNGKPINVEGGFGKVKFKAVGGKYDAEGLMKKQYKAEIKLDEENKYDAMIDYFVAKPVIQVQSQSVNALYLGCGNELNVQVPALGTNYNPTFSATGGTTIKGPKKGLVTVVPNKAEVALTVRSSGDLIGTEKFKVRRVPLPTIHVQSRNRDINVKKGESISRLRSINVKAVPDEGFKQFLPKDARYRVTKWEVTLARGSRPVGTPKRVTSESVSLADFASRARPGDRLVIEVKEVQRMNFRGKVEKVPLGTFNAVIPLTE